MDEGLLTETSPLRRNREESAILEKIHRRSKLSFCISILSLVAVIAGVVFGISYTLSTNASEHPSNLILPEIPEPVKHDAEDFGQIWNLHNHHNIWKSGGHQRITVNQSVLAEALEECEKAVKDLEQFLKDGSTADSIMAGDEMQVASVQSASAEDSAKYGMTGLCNTVASTAIAIMLNLTKEDLAHRIPIYFANGTQQSGPWCVPQIDIVCDPKYPYRQTNGSCNNLGQKYWGLTPSPYRRLLPPDYADGVNSPRKALDGEELPNVRTISTSMFPDRDINDSEHTMMTPQFGQFLAHDLTKFVIVSGFLQNNLSCCVHAQVPNTQNASACFPIVIPPNDKFYKRPDVNRGCLSLIRSAPFPYCDFGVRDQYSDKTPYLDLSQVYGGNPTVEADLRGAPSWKLKTSPSDEGTTLLPSDHGFVHLCSKAGENELGHYCFKAGDDRLNIFPGITSMHTIWVRHHNRVAEKLRYRNPDWDDERTYQEAKRLLIAQAQHIVYSEYIPSIIGPKFMKLAGLELQDSGYYKNYDPQMDATVSNAFAAAAFRFGHSMLQGRIEFADNEKLTGHCPYRRLSKLIFDPFVLYKKSSLDSIVNGLTQQPAAKLDRFYTREITDHLFQGNRASGFDLAALNIQRGRDHGLPGYVHYRRICGLTPVKTFEDLEGIWTEDAIPIAKSLYKVPEDIDIYVGGIVELPVEGGIVGPTFACLIAEQFARLRKGDRFWYEGDSQPMPFTPAQLESIRNMSTARIFCENGDNIQHMQRNVFLKPSKHNPYSACSSDVIPSENYDAWKE